MTTYKKTIVLTNSTLSNYNGNAILTLNKTGDGIYGTLKTYNITNEPNLVLGLSQNGKQILKQNINLINNNTYNFKLSNLDLNQNISCVLVKDEPTKVIPLIWGSDNKTQLTDQIVENLNNLKSTSSTLQTYQVDPGQIFESSENEIENTITDALSEDIFDNNQNKIEDLELSNNNNIIKFDSAENFEDANLSDTENIINEFEPNYPDNFNLYNQKNESISKILSNKSIIDEEVENLNLTDNETFYDNISDQIEDLFSKYPAETNLETLIPNSKWVKIDYENTGNYYVLGLIYEDISLKYICYGVPGEYSDTAPNGLDNYSQWLPTNMSEPTSNGYWVMYQDALTGESILVDAI